MSSGLGGDDARVAPGMFGEGLTMALMHDWLPTWPRMRMPNRAVLPVRRVDVTVGLVRLDAAESYPCDTEPPEQKPETGKAEE